MQLHLYDKNRIYNEIICIYRIHINVTSLMQLIKEGDFMEHHDISYSLRYSEDNCISSKSTRRLSLIVNVYCVVIKAAF